MGRPGPPTETTGSLSASLRPPAHRSFPADRAAPCWPGGPYAALRSGGWHAGSVPLPSAERAVTTALGGLGSLRLKVIGCGLLVATGAKCTRIEHMFDSAHAARGAQSAAPWPMACRASPIPLHSATVTGLDDAAIIARIDALERAKAACAAEQVRLTARFVESQAASAERLRAVERHAPTPATSTGGSLRVTRSARSSWSRHDARSRAARAAGPDAQGGRPCHARGSRRRSVWPAASRPHAAPGSPTHRWRSSATSRTLLPR